MSQEDYQKGLSGIGSGSGMDYLKGVNEREREREAARPKPPLEPTTYVAPYEPTSPGAGAQPHRPASPPSRPMPETMQSMAKSGAGLLLVLFVGYTLLIGGAWTWPWMIGGGVAASALGAVAGAALYVAIRLLMILLRIAGMLLAVGIVLHLFGVLDLVAVLSRIGRALGL